MDIDTDSDDVFATEDELIEEIESLKFAAEIQQERHILQVNQLNQTVHNLQAEILRLQSERNNAHALEHENTYLRRELAKLGKAGN